MAGYRREDWEDLNITREEVETLTEAFKKEEFRKLLQEYAEEITDPKNKKQYQDDIIQLEAERGIDCTFVNPEPGFVVKSSVDGKRKAFINICKNKAIGKPNCKRELKDNNIGLSWSIPMCQSPCREDFDKKRNRCSVYDVVFHPDTLHLAEKNPQFKKLVVDTALNAVEDSFKVKLDKKNITFPKLDYKGYAVATVIRKKSKNPPILTEEDIEFNKAIKYPYKPPSEGKPVVKNYETKKEDLAQKYTVPKYSIKHRTGIDLQEFTYDKNAKVNVAIPKELVVEINLPLLNSTSNVTLDIMEKSLSLLCEKPVKYKLDLQLPYSVCEETGSAKFDKDKRILTVVLPVMKAKLSFRDLMREDSGVESDLSPVGSVSNTEFIEDGNSGSSDSDHLIKEEEDIPGKTFKLNSEESEGEKDHRTKIEDNFLDSDKHYLLPSFSCNLDDDKLCFVLNVKNVNPDSVVKKSINAHACHIKFFSIGSGYFPVYYAFLIDFKEECDIESVSYDTWDNNITVLVELVKSDRKISQYYVGLNEEALVLHHMNQPLELKKVMEDSKVEEEDDDSHVNVNIESANQEEVTVSIIPEEDEEDDEDDDEESENVYDIDEEQNKNIASSAPGTLFTNKEEKSRTISESSADDYVSQPVRKSILKNRAFRSLSESNADDYCSSSVDKMEYNGSEDCVHIEHDGAPCIKKTVRFNDRIYKQLFRVNSSILGQKKKNQKKSRNKKRALERRLSESENSEVEDKERDKKTKKSLKSKKKSLIKVLPPKEEKENCDVSKEKQTVESEEKKPKYGLKKDDKIFEFKSDLIFDLDV